MIVIECPLCLGPAATDESLSALTCEDCDVTVDATPEHSALPSAIAA
jgi:hypothetical protein